MDKAIEVVGGELDPRTAAEVMETHFHWENLDAVCVNFEDAAGPCAVQVFTGEALEQQLTGGSA